MDQGAQLVDSPMHGLKKGNANDYDLIVVGLINVLTSLFGLPFMHGLLPHSPLHVQSLCDWNESYDTRGQVKTHVVVHVRETRLAAILCHLLICFSVLLSSSIFTDSSRRFKWTLSLLGIIMSHRQLLLPKAFTLGDSTVKVP